MLFVDSYLSVIGKTYSFTQWLTKRTHFLDNRFAIVIRCALRLLQIVLYK